MVALLAIDTAAAACSAALWRDGAIRARARREMARGHAEALMPMVVSVMKAAGAAFADLDAVAVTVGPGSFTGVRVGLAAARALGLAADVPVVGVTTLEAASRAVPVDERRNRRVLAVLDSRRGDFFAQLFDADLTPLIEPMVGDAAAVVGLSGEAPLVVAGDGSAAVAEALAAAGRDVVRARSAAVPDAAEVAAIAAGRLPARPAPPPSPVYLRAPALTPERHGGRIRP